MLSGVSPRTGLAASSSVSPGHAGEGFFFRTFPQNERSAKLSPQSGSELSADFTSSTPVAHVDSLAVVELLAKFKQLSGQVGEMDRRSEHMRQGFSSDIDMLYRLIAEARHRLQQLEAWADEVAGDDDGPG